MDDEEGETTMVCEFLLVRSKTTAKKDKWQKSDERTPTPSNDARSKGIQIFGTFSLRKNHTTTHAKPLGYPNIYATVNYT